MRKLLPLLFLLFSSSNIMAQGVDLPDDLEDVNLLGVKLNYGLDQRYGIEFQSETFLLEKVLGSYRYKVDYNFEYVVLGAQYDLGFVAGRSAERFLFIPGGLFYFETETPDFNDFEIVFGIGAGFELMYFINEAVAINFRFQQCRSFGSQISETPVWLGAGILLNRF